MKNTIFNRGFLLGVVEGTKALSGNIPYAEQSLEILWQIKSAPEAELPLEILGKLAHAGYPSFLVGGCVRDIILQRVPKDYDIATSAKPEQVKALFPNSVHVGAKFGVTLVRGQATSVEVATFREDGTYLDNRRPETVSFGDITSDAARRDFTVNAMYLDVCSGKVIDFYAGLQDLRAGIIRCVGHAEQRFNEDALRMLRAVRFAANLDFELEVATHKAIIWNIALLSRISAERCRDELKLGFTGPDPARFLDLLDDTGILKMLLPEVTALHNCEQPPQFHPEGDVYTHTRLMLEKLKEKPSVELVFSVLLHDIGKPPTQTVSDRIRFNGHAGIGSKMCEVIGRRLRFRKDEIAAVCHIVARHMDFINVPKMRTSTLRRFLANEWIEDELELHRVDCLASHQDLSTYTFACDVYTRLKRETRDKITLPKPFVTGDDLIAMGFKPGSQFKNILKQVFDYQLDNPEVTPDYCLEMARILASEP